MYGRASLHFCSQVDAAMSAPKFKIGDTVFLEGSLNVPGGAYVVIRLLPEQNGEFGYQIKSAREPHDRVVRESQLSVTS